MASYGGIQSSIAILMYQVRIKERFRRLEDNLSFGNNSINLYLVNRLLTRRKSTGGLKVNTLVSDEKMAEYLIKKLFSRKNVDLKTKSEKEAIIRLPKFKFVPSEEHKHTSRIKRSSQVRSTNSVQNLSLVNYSFNVHDNQNYANSEIASKQNTSYDRLALNSRDEDNHLTTQIKDTFSSVFHKSKSIPFNLPVFSSETELKKEEEAGGRNSFSNALQHICNITTVTEMISNIYLDQMNKLRCEEIDTNYDKETNSKISHSDVEKTAKSRTYLNSLYKCKIEPFEDELFSSLESINL